VYVKLTVFCHFLYHIHGLYTRTSYLKGMQGFILQNLYMSEWKCVVSEGLYTGVNKEMQEVYVLLNQGKIQTILGKYQILLFNTVLLILQTFLTFHDLHNAI
jgi:hypothetical protein